MQSHMATMYARVRDLARRLTAAGRAWPARVRRWLTAARAKMGKSARP